MPGEAEENHLKLWFSRAEGNQPQLSVILSYTLVFLNNITGVYLLQ
jgi:hypothetical protein